MESNNQTINKLRELGERILPKDAQFILYGSRARNDTKDDSDWDILVVLNKEGSITQSDFGLNAHQFQKSQTQNLIRQISRKKACYSTKFLFFQLKLNVNGKKRAV